MFIFALYEGLVAQKLIRFPKKMEPRCTRPATLANQLSHVLTVVFVCFIRGEFRQKLFVKNSMNGREDQ